MSVTAEPDCGGDCNLDGKVAINELIAAVDMAARAANDVARCPTLDDNNDSRITIDELVRAVNRSLEGCPSA
jgi:Ca2+-binding EF-hand superfamily protein